MKNELSAESRAELDQQWFANFDKLAAEHGADRVTYALVTRIHKCSTSTIGDRLRRWKLIQSTIQGSKIPSGYAELLKQQHDMMKAFVSVDLEQEKAAHKKTQSDLEDSQKQCDKLERDSRAREKTLTDRISELEAALNAKTLECSQRDKVLAGQSGELHELKATAKHQQELIQTLQATLRANDGALTELRQQLQQRQQDIDRFRSNEDRLNTQLDAVRQKLKALETPVGRLPRKPPRKRKPTPSSP